jgi:hypothetical protein
VEAWKNMHPLQVISGSDVFSYSKGINRAARKENGKHLTKLKHCDLNSSIYKTKEAYMIVEIRSIFLQEKKRRCFDYLNDLELENGNMLTKTLSSLR